MWNIIDHSNTDIWYRSRYNGRDKFDRLGTQLKHILWVSINQCTGSMISYGYTMGKFMGYSIRYFFDKIVGYKVSQYT